MSSTLFITPWKKKIDLKVYDKIKSLGSGSFGETFLYQKDDHKIAVKKLLHSINKRKAILNEINVLKKLGKGCERYNVLCFSQVEIYHNNTCIITEYIDGMDLRDFFGKIVSSNFSEYYQSITSMFCQLIRAIKYIHTKNVCHYDIKPENIMISNNGVLKLIDFGLSKTGYPIIEVSGYTRKYAPLYYWSERKFKTWNFSEAKTVDTFCLISSFYKVSKLDRPLEVINTILNYHWNMFTEQDREIFVYFMDLIDIAEQVQTECNTIPMQTDMYNYLLDIHEDYFMIPPSSLLKGSVNELITQIISSNNFIDN